MSTKTIILIIVAAAILFIAAFLYSVLPRNKTASKLAPFKELIGQELTTLRPAILLKGESYEMAYVDYKLYDPIQRYSAIIEATVSKWTLPAGTKLQITEAKLRYGAVSGFTTPFLIGTVKHPETGEIVVFEYSWGEESVARSFDKIKERWTFPLAPWQQQEDTTWYMLPEF